MASDADPSDANENASTNTCEHLEYREDDRFPTERAYCTVVGEFVRPVRADVCNARYDLAPAEHCEYYREHEGIEDEWLTDDATDGGENGQAATDGSEES